MRCRRLIRDLFVDLWKAYTGNLFGPIEGLSRYLVLASSKAYTWDHFVPLLKAYMKALFALPTHAHVKDPFIGLNLSLV